MVTSDGATDPLVDSPLAQLASADPNSTLDNQNSGGGDGGKQPAATSGSKKRKDDSSKDKDKKPKKTRQTQSCDACRARKVKCDRPPPGSAPSDSPTVDVCTHCKQLGMACTFKYKPKKRGPPNMYLKRMQALSQAALNESMDMSGRAVPKFPVDLRDDVLGGPGPGTLANQNALHRSALSVQGGGQPIPRGRDAVDDWGPALARTVAAHQGGDPHASTSDRPRLSLSFMSGGPVDDQASMDPHRRLSGPQTSPNYNSNYMMPNNPNPLEAIIPRPLLHHIIDLYFDYVYCLIPALHKPTFMRNLHSRREEQPGQEEWVALVFAVVEVTLVQMPRSFVALSKQEIKALFSNCSRAVKSYLDRDFSQLTINRNIILYLYVGHSIIADCSHCVADDHSGNSLMCSQLWGSNCFLAMKLRLHEEASYKDLNPIEREMRKRVFWLLYGGDKTDAAVDNQPVVWHEVDCSDVTLPSPLDDEFVTEEGYLQPPEGHEPVLAGFYYISKLFRLLGQLLDKKRHDKVKPPSGVALQVRLNEVEEIFHQVMTLMDDCPPALKIDINGTAATAMALIDEHWDAQVSADIRQLLFDPTANRAIVKDTFLVQQANIYVTQQMVRYIALQYREELGILQDKEFSSLEGTQPPGAPVRRRPPPRTRFLDEEKHQIASDLLVILSKIRIEVIAVNSISLVAKIRFVASTLLDALQQPQNSTDPRTLEGNARAQGHLWDFLRILSDVEALIVMDDNEGQD